jgi:DHA1 family tetracycline resistance protein-like MFS transporter
MRKYPAVLTLAAAAFLWQLGHQVLPSVWAFYTMQKFQWSVTAVGMSLAAAGVVMAISQGALTRVLIPKLGERRSALIGLSAGAVVYCWYALAPAGWMMYLGVLAWAVAALAWPSLNALMSQQIPPTAQGELQGGLASVSSLSAIIGPPLMTQLFGYFASAAAPVQFPGAPFIAAALLAVLSAVMLARGATAAATTFAQPEAAE